MQEDIKKQKCPKRDKQQKKKKKKKKIDVMDLWYLCKLIRISVALLHSLSY